jgi:hypothetical protein
MGSDKDRHCIVTVVSTYDARPFAGLYDVCPFAGLPCRSAWAQLSPFLRERFFSALPDADDAPP